MSSLFPLIWKSFSVFVFLTWQFFIEDRAILCLVLEKVLHFGFDWSFLMFRLGFCIFWQRYHWGDVVSLSMYGVINVHLFHINELGVITWLRCFLHHKVTAFLFMSCKLQLICREIFWDCVNILFLNFFSDYCGIPSGCSDSIVSSRFISWHFAIRKIFPFSPCTYLSMNSWILMLFSEL